MCITTYQPDTKSDPNPNNTTKQHAIVNIQLNIQCGQKSKPLPNYRKVVLKLVNEIRFIGKIKV